MAVDHVPVREGSNSYHVNPAPVGAIRKLLFDLLAGNGAEAALAARCLSAIDRLRDDHGIADNDPRNPDIMADKPWPPEAALNPAVSSNTPKAT